MNNNIPKKRLVDEAIAAREKSIAPYSGYTVGAALLTGDAAVITAGNIESSTYGLTLCAERVAMFSALADGYREFQAIAVSTRNGGSPCGSCRQILWEYAGDIPVYMVADDGAVTVENLSDLLPLPFDKSKLQPPADS